MQINADVRNIKRALLLTVYFLKLHTCVYLRTKFEVSSIILTTFRHGVVVILPYSTSKWTPKKSTYTRVNDEKIVGSFYEKELQKTDQEEFRIEKVIKRKRNKLYLK